MGDSPKPLDIGFSKRFATNLITNILYFIINGIIGLLLVPYYLDILGTSAYGIIPLATSITSYVVLFIDAVNGSISRFLTLDLQRADTQKANETFNTAFFGLSGIAIITLPISILFAWFCPYLFNIGNEATFSVFLLFAFIFLAVIINTISGNFFVTLFAYNRLDLRNYLYISRLISQVACLIFLFTFFGPSLEYVGISYFIAAMISLFLSWWLSKKTASFLILSISYFQKKRFLEIIGMSIWILLAQFGFLIRTQIALILINILLGTIAGAQYSLILILFTLILSVGSLILNTLTPMVYSYNSKNDCTGMISFVSFSIKCVVLFMALPVVLVCLFSSQLFDIWVGDEYTNLAPILWLLLPPAILRLGASCIVPIYQSYLKVKIPALCNIIVGIINILLMILFIQIFDNQLYGIAIASSISLIIYEFLFVPIYSSHIMKVSPIIFYKSFVYGIIAICLLSIFGLLLLSIIPVNSILIVLILSTFISGVYICVLFIFIFTRKEKAQLWACMPSWLSNLAPKWLH